MTVPSTRSNPPRAPLLGLAVTAALAATAATALWQQPARAAGPTIRPIPAADSGLSIGLFVDAKKNNQFKDADPDFDAFTYTAKTESDEVAIRLDSRDILDLWKGDGTITSTIDGASSYFEDSVQFSPVFLVLDITNKGQRAAQISRSFLEIESSATDLQPYIYTYANDPACMSGFDPSFSFINNGWGEAQNGTLTFAFGDQSGPKTKELTIDVGEVANSKDLSALDSFKALGVDTDKLSGGDFQCASEDAYDRCLADWKGSDLLAPMAGAVFSNESYLFTRLYGHFDYDWTDVAGAVHKRTSPAKIDFLLLNVGPGPECGAGGPTERDFATFKLPLDVTNVRLPLKLADKLAPRQEKRYGLNLIAEKSSHHRFRLVVELADGSTITSPTADLEYFLPHLDWTN